MKGVFKQTEPNGLTLVEVVVAIGLFSILVLIGVRIFSRMTEIQERTKEAQNLAGDLRYAMDVLTDESENAVVHLNGDDIICGSTGCAADDYFCVNLSNDHLYLRDKNGLCVQYYLSNGSVVINREGTLYTITSDDITVTGLTFLASGLKDRVVVQVAAVGAGDYSKTINYQTAITSTALR